MTWWEWLLIGLAAWVVVGFLFGIVIGPFLYAVGRADEIHAEILREIYGDRIFQEKEDDNG